MKAVLLALVVFAAVLAAAQASPAADFNGVAVVESALKGIGNIPKCLVSVPGTLIGELVKLGQSCFSSFEALPICLMGGVQQLIQDVAIEFSQCLSS